ncbi:hypothetical protein [Paenibacillus sp. NAIST15-1]|uniref:hypothetical protein n=1 Tax=Paenibacillus sp. NAIST15-1 TaxID=1605994 RepID=UPI00086D4286|nr:hypothetical protein [Paenibacillus sp. NAIST15-1]GAV11310.1 hypothetical protein PBN151_1237 [Paenibacillus sp. NAIST15-1]
MKKTFIVVFTLVMMMISTNVVKAAEANQVSTKVDYIYFDKTSKVYYAVSVKDADGGHWVVDLLYYDTYDEVLEKALNKSLKGKKLKISYEGNLETDEEVLIVESEIVK